MAEEKATCAIVLLSTDMEWMHALNKGLQRFFLVNERKVDSLAALDAALDAAPADVVVAQVAEGMPTVDKVRAVLAQKSPDAGFIAISQGQRLDEQIKLGAEFSLSRMDLLSAIRMVQQIMRVKELQITAQNEQKKATAQYDLYQRLYHNSPDPICYLQDGLFIDVNPAFLRVFKVEDRAALDALTIMSFVPLKTERTLKQMMKLALEKEIVPAEQMELITSGEENLEMMVQAAHVMMNGEQVIQLYFRDKNASGGGSTIDPTTGLGGPEVLQASIKQIQERSEEKAFLGTWIYFWLENYREVLQKDGIAPAEILMKSTAEMCQRLLPPSTEIARYHDDALLIWVTGDKEQTIVRFKNLIERLDESVPENIGRMIHPHTFAGMQELLTESDFSDLLSKGFRSVRSMAMGQAQERIAEPTSANMSRKDERRIYQIQQLIKQNRLAVRYQPISAIEPDGIPRFSDFFHILPDPDIPEGEEEELELEQLLQTAERFKLGRIIERYKINRFLQDVLSFSGDQAHLTAFLKVMGDALNDEEFAPWIANQLKQTGINPKQLVFELGVDTVFNNFTGTLNLIEVMRPLGARIAIADLARLEDDINELFARIKPEVIKLDLREIDTFEEDEEVKFMKGILEYAKENNVMLIADHMESPAQLSRVWPYDVPFVQGDCILPPLENFNYDFKEPIF